MDALNMYFLLRSGDIPAIAMFGHRTVCIKGLVTLFLFGCLQQKGRLPGGFKHFLFSSLFGEDDPI